MSWLSNIKNNWQQKFLTRPELAGMFAPANKGEWIALDCEMTGLNPQKNHILSVACVHINANHKGIQIDSGNGLNLVCRPLEMPMPDTIVIHGLRPSDVEHGMSYDDMLAILLPFVGNRPIIGFCPQIDISFLNPLVKSYMGTKLPNQVIDIRTLQSRRTGNRTEGIAHQGQTLENILETYHIPKLAEHDAYNDALMTAMAFVHLQHNF